MLLWYSHHRNFVGTKTQKFEAAWPSWDLKKLLISTSSYQLKIITESFSGGSQSCTRSSSGSLLLVSRLWTFSTTIVTASWTTPSSISTFSILHFGISLVGCCIISCTIVVAVTDSIADVISSTTSTTAHWGRRRSGAWTHFFGQRLWGAKRGRMWVRSLATVRTEIQDC